MTLYEVAIVDDDSVLVAPVCVMAENEKAAIFTIAQKHPGIKIKKVTVLVRPFV